MSFAKPTRSSALRTGEAYTRIRSLHPAPSGAPVADQLRILRTAVDSLTSILMDELDKANDNVSSVRSETQQQIAAVSKIVEALPIEVARELESSKTSVAKLDRRAENGVRRLNEALSVQQQALTDMAKDVGKIDRAAARQEDDAKRASERFERDMEQLRAQVPKT